jgi:hypothetical protein
MGTLGFSAHNASCKALPLSTITEFASIRHLGVPHPLIKAWADAVRTLVRSKPLAPMVYVSQIEEKITT